MKAPAKIDERALLTPRQIFERLDRFVVPVDA